MEDKQRVYIKGDPERAKDIIKLLEDLGGRNTKRVLGVKDNAYYFINPNGEIDFNYTSGPKIPYIKGFYKEIKLPKWKPEYKGCYYYINITGFITKCKWNDSIDDIRCYEFGNCFKTLEEAMPVRDKIREMLKK